MEKYIYDNSNGLWYELHGEYYLPCLVIPEEEVHSIGIWGRKHQQYLREYRPIIYSDLVLSGKLYGYLSDIDTQARNKLDLLVTQLAEKEGINESLKAQNIVDIKHILQLVPPRKCYIFPNTYWYLFLRTFFEITITTKHLAVFWCGFMSA